MRDASTLETFYILEGEIMLFEDGVEQPKYFGPGDLVVLEPVLLAVGRPPARQEDLFHNKPITAQLWRAAFKRSVLSQ